MNAITKNVDAEQLAALLDAQRAAFLRDGSPSLAHRRADLAKLKKALIDRRDAIEAAIDSDFGHRSRHETAIMEIFGVVGGIDYLRKNLRRFMRPERRHVSLLMQFGRAWIEYQPVGVVGVISPWNYPVNLSMMPVVTAIAAGNRVMLKPSKLTPATNAVLASMLREIFPEQQVTLVNGDGSAFSSLPFDHLVFTGSPAVGRAVMEAASKNLVPVTLELGGKSPTIVSKGSVCDRTVSAIVYGKLLSGGQTCIAPDYALVHESEVSTFVESYDRLVKTAYPDGPTSADYTSIVNDQQYSMLTDLINDARAHGARIIEVGHRPGDATRRPHTLAPTVVLGVTDEMKIAHEEIFGPILPILSYGRIDDAIAYVNARPRPLALYYFGNDADRRKVLDNTTSGNAMINGTIMHVAQDDLPFGGIGTSGIGAYHGIEGFKRLSHAKGVYAQGRWNALKLFRPPFGKPVDRLLNIMLR
ncbi:MULTISPECIES: coniferyl aldehyde dehydrogenase [unclassified Mesorhizobium]|uniref:coniferyl aldehyde dehydrogenase n=1 Tax=unclassified Mesorhizobium TaxID=325217 RepID=UPI0003CE7169|nr:MULTISPECIES: coniferyl aldehyde dehydrogenase [unclassified Mesorhizobium]ESY16408.1 coniferyl aldehyde dehydrogenase [Mesorhizobium sp. LNJC394B00]ESZ74103.1 coniferyl aldehyde dehydrogenase [Mesorhizobium sp. L103C105A0]